MIRRALIVNADDLGYDPAIDRGIVEAHRRGLVTSATAMVDTPFAAAALAEAPSTLAIGLHLVLDPARADEVAGEIERQLERFRALRGSAPTHLDGHKHAHAHPSVLPAVARAARAAALPVRALDGPMRAVLRAQGVRTTDHFLGDAALRPCWTLERLLAAIEGLEEGTTELMAHPGYRPERARTSFGVEREIELASLCDPRARALIERAEIVLARPGAASP